MEQESVTFMCSRSGRDAGCTVVTTSELSQCCLCDAPASVVGPRGSHYCTSHGRCGRCGTSVIEFVLERQGSVYICPCFWDWDPAMKQRKVKQPTLMSGHYQHGGKV